MTHQALDRSAAAGVASPASRRRRDRTFLSFLAPALIVLAVLSLLPSLFALYLAATDLHLVRPGSGQYVGLANFARMLDDEFFWSSVRVTLLLIVLPVAVQMVLGVAMALLLYRRGPLAQFARPLFMAPMVIAPIVAGLTWKVLFLPNLGGLNYMLSVVGLPAVHWLENARMATASVTLVTVWQYTPFVMLLTLAALESLPDEPIEAAIVDGANSWQRFRHVILPLITPVLMVVVIFRLIESLQIFPVIYVLTQGGPGSSTEVLNYFAYLQGFSYLNIGYASAVSVAILALVLILSFAFLHVRLREASA